MFFPPGRSPHCVCRWTGGSSCRQTQGFPSRWVFWYPSCSQTGTWFRSTVPHHRPWQEWSWPEKLSEQIWLVAMSTSLVPWWTLSFWVALLGKLQDEWAMKWPLQGSKRRGSTEWGYLPVTLYIWVYACQGQWIWLCPGRCFQGLGCGEGGKTLVDHQGSGPELEDLDHISALLLPPWAGQPPSPFWALMSSSVGNAYHTRLWGGHLGSSLWLPLRSPHPISLAAASSGLSCNPMSPVEIPLSHENGVIQCS